MLLLMMVYNAMIVPKLAEQQIETVDYGTFMTMTENGQIKSVQIEENKIVFTTPNHDGAKYDYYLALKGTKKDYSDASFYGPLSPNNAYTLTIKNIKANKKYTFRAYYFKKAEYGG